MPRSAIAAKQNDILRILLRQILEKKIHTHCVALRHDKKASCFFLSPVLWRSFTDVGSYKFEITPRGSAKRSAVPDLDIAVLRTVCAGILREMQDSGDRTGYAGAALPAAEFLKLHGTEPSGDTNDDALLAARTAMRYSGIDGKLGTGSYALLQFTESSGETGMIRFDSPCISELIAAVLRERARTAG